MQSIYPGADVEDSEEMAAIVHLASGEPRNRSGKHAAVQDVSTARTSGQQVFTHGAQADR